VRTAGIRNKPVDRRYLSDKDKSDYNNGGGYGKAAQAVGRARAYRGQIAYERNRPPATVTRTPGTGGIGGGIQVQQQRLGKFGTSSRSGYSLDKPSAKGDIFGK